ncbi:hypothetical protein [Cutibacterium sp.]|uniref:hypothetical protein n=1 Tax=Cutibacterium sp. TaxID=1912221 RepID=UPI0026DC75FC|nr:hypothetical protein [Cutibacterium sp.]MDO4412441.1 hypothetical protein [Cutibacterium sp.]
MILRSLFDPSFEYYVTPKIAKIFCLLATIFAVAMWIGTVITAGVGGDDTHASEVLVVLTTLLG